MRIYHNSLLAFLMASASFKLVGCGRNGIKPARALIKENNTQFIHHLNTINKHDKNILSNIGYN
jgi:hypothetical protein